MSEASKWAFASLGFACVGLLCLAIDALTLLLPAIAAQFFCFGAQVRSSRR